MIDLQHLSVIITDMDMLITNECFYAEKQFKLRKFTHNNKKIIMIQLKEGIKAPGLEGIDQNGNIINLGDFKGKKVILYFYPKDDTPGCTAEACNLRDNWDTFLNNGFAVIGVSPDTEKSHKKFAEKYSLPFPIIADTSKKILHDYGVWGEKKMYGKSYMGVLRTTFLIDEKGNIEKIIPKVITGGHSDQIFEMYKQ
jgi:peroxiredoxin Q/BCP